MVRFSLLLAAVLMSGPAAAWEAGRVGAVCTLTHAEGPAVVRLTHDPTVPIYTISLTTPEPWPRAPLFAMIFDGGQPNTLTTDRHVLSADRRTLTVSDRGFGNVLDGLEFNTSAFGVSGERVLQVSLDGAARAVSAFRACGALPLS